MYQAAYIDTRSVWAVVGEFGQPIAVYPDHRHAQALAEWANRQVREGNLSDDEINRQLCFEAAA